MKTLSALLGSAIAAIGLLLGALIATGCTANTPATQAETIPVVPTNLVFSVDAPGGFDRSAIAYHENKDAKPETFRVEGQAQTISLDDAFQAIDDTTDLYDFADLSLANELSDGTMTDGYSTEISVLKAVTCKSVADRMPVEAGSSFSLADGKVWCHTEVALPAGKSGMIQHVWRYQGVEQLRVELYVEGPTYRTSSFKTLQPAHGKSHGSRGFWTVEVTAENGDVLDVVEFEVE